MESTLQNPALISAKPTLKAKIGYWIVTTPFCLQMSFTAYAQLRLLPGRALVGQAPGCGADHFSSAAAA